MVNHLKKSSTRCSKAVVTRNGGLGLMGQVGSQVIHGRWFMVFASQLIMAMSGANYLFSIYSNDIKASMGYDQTTLNLISFFKDIGFNAGILSGLIGEVTPAWVCLTIGATVNFFGYFMIWLAVTGHLKGFRVWQMCVFICIGANSQTFAFTGTMATCVKNFSQSRGVVIGLLTGFLGLSGAIIIEIYHALCYNESSTSLILLISTVPPIVTIVLARSIRVVKTTRAQNETSIFYNLLYISLCLAGFIMVMIILQSRVKFSRLAYSASAIVIIVFLLLPLVVAIKQEYSLTILSTENNHNEDADKKRRDLIVVNNIAPKQPHVVDEELSCWTNAFNPPKRGEDYTILQALFSIDMVLICISSICGVGGTLTAVDNMGQLGVSLGYPAQNIATFVSLISIWNYLGRVLTGLASDIALKKYKFSRPLMMAVLLLFSCIGHVVLAFAPPNSLYVASVISGLCFGAQIPLILAIISDIFGLKYYSTLQNFASMVVPIGSYIIKIMVTGKLYDRVALQQLNLRGLTRKPGDVLSCVGVECYKLSFLIIAGITCFGSVASFILALRTRKFYNRDIYKTFREASLCNP